MILLIFGLIFFAGIIIGVYLGFALGKHRTMRLIAVDVAKRKIPRSAPAPVQASRRKLDSILDAEVLE